MTTSPVHGHGVWVVAVTTALLTLVAGCGDPAPQPQASVNCAPKAIDINLTNKGDAPAAYTVTVSIDRAGLVEEEKYSSNTVAPGASATLSDDRPDDQETCTIESIEVFPR